MLRSKYYDGCPPDILKPNPETEARCSKPKISHFTSKWVTDIRETGQSHKCLKKNVYLVDLKNYEKDKLKLDN